jgi:hypothetical protein
MSKSWPICHLTLVEFKWSMLDQPIYSTVEYRASHGSNSNESSRKRSWSHARCTAFALQHDIRTTESIRQIEGTTDRTYVDRMREVHQYSSLLVSVQKGQRRSCARRDLYVSRWIYSKCLGFSCFVTRSKRCFRVFGEINDDDETPPM